MTIYRQQSVKIAAARNLGSLRC